MEMKPGKIETRLSMVFMATLIIVGAGVYLSQFQINPAVIALRPESHRNDLSPERAALIDTTEFGIRPFSPPERFGPDTLYEKINGRADLYLASGFVSLETQRFTTEQTAGNWVELFVYDMATPANAFSVFSMQRRDDARAAEIVTNAYQTENALFMTHGNAYLEIIGTDASETLQQAMGLLAQGFIKMHGGKMEASEPGAGMFPEDGLQADSLQLITANAFGYEQLDRIYTCEYLIDNSRLTAFVSERQNPEAASLLADEYRQTLASYGATTVDTSLSVDGVATMQFFDTYEIIFSRGRFLAGIHEAGNLEAAKTLARWLSDHLEASERR
jgi:hypothetical protein